MVSNPDFAANVAQLCDLTCDQWQRSGKNAIFTKKSHA